MDNRFYKILEKSFSILFFITLAVLFLKGEVFRIHTRWLNIAFTSAKNFILVLIAWWIVLNIKTRPKVSLYLVLLLIGTGISIMFSKYPLISIKAGFVLLIYTLWFFMVKDFLKDKNRIINIIILFTALAGVVNLMDLYFHYSTDINEILERYPFWQGKNALGLFLVIALCVSSSISIKSGWKFLVWVNIFLLIPGIIFSYSRSAWIAGIAVVFLLLIIKFKRAIWLLLTLIAILFFISPKLVSDRCLSVIKKEDINVKERLGLWSDTIEVIKIRPLTGTGLGTFMRVQMDNHPDLYKERGEGTRIIRHAHNLYLQILAENGILGFMIFMFLAVSGFIYGIKNIISEKNQHLKSIRLGCLLGITAFFVYSITDCTLSWRFTGDSFSHINLIQLLLWAIVL